jgi:hypothetical protein
VTAQKLVTARRLMTARKLKSTRKLTREERSATVGRLTNPGRLTSQRGLANPGRLTSRRGMTGPAGPRPTLPGCAGLIGPAGGERAGDRTARYRLPGRRGTVRPRPTGRGSRVSRPGRGSALILVTVPAERGGVQPLVGQ